MSRVKPLREFSAGEITQFALKVLDLRNVEAWRANNIAIRGRKFIGRKGATDIQGYHRMTGQACYTEVKKIGDTIKPDQRKFLTEAKQAGCLCLVATQQGNEVVLKDFEID